MCERRKDVQRQDEPAVCLAPNSSGWSYLYPDKSKSLWGRSRRKKRRLLQSKLQKQKENGSRDLFYVRIKATLCSNATTDHTGAAYHISAPQTVKRPGQTPWGPPEVSGSDALKPGRLSFLPTLTPPTSGLIGGGTETLAPDTENGKKIILNEIN